jgi:hypothetical protein
MGLKDLFKDVTDLAKDSIDSLQEDIALKKAEQQRLREEMEKRIQAFTDNLLAQLTTNSDPQAQPLLAGNEDELVAFTSDFAVKLLLPANSASATRIDLHPYEEKVLPNISRIFTGYQRQEKFLFQFKDAKGQLLLGTTTKLYFKVVFPENTSFYSIGSIPTEQLFNLEISRDEQQFQFLVNDVPLITAPGNEIQNFDFVTLLEYLRRLKAKEFAIDDDQINAFIPLKLDPTTLEITARFLDSGEKLVYFAWGLDSLGARKFLFCTDRKIVLYDRDLNADKRFNYADITSIATQKSTVSFLDLSLTLGMNPNDLEIQTAGAIETISILYDREAQRLVQLCHHYQGHDSAPAARTDAAVTPEPAEDQPTGTAAEDPLAMIEKLADLKAKGIISEAEFNQKKQELLAKL